MLYVNENGSKWQGLPASVGPWRTIYPRSSLASMSSWTRAAAVAKPTDSHRCQAARPNTRTRSNSGKTFNGVTFNGVTFNGVTFNGVTFNGVTFNGVTFNGVTFNGVTFNGVTFNEEPPGGNRIEALATVSPFPRRASKGA